MRDIKQEMLERHTAINKAFGRMYFAIYSVDLESGYYMEVSTLDIFKEHIPSTEKNQHLFDMVVKYYVSEGYKEGMRVFLDMSTLQERLAEQNAVSNEFFGTTQGWCRASLVVEKRAEDGRVLRFVYVTQEINEEVKTEQDRIVELKQAYKAADNANQAKSDFLFRMSHDIRTPLNAIMGFDDLIEYNINNPDKVMEYVKKIRVSGNLLLSLLNEILDMTKIESNHAELAFVSFDLRDMLKELLMVIRTQTTAKGQKLVVDTERIVHDGWTGDKVRLSRVLFNLLGNAVKYTGQGGEITFTAREEAISADRSMLVFVVRDNGIGISEELQKHVFDEFQRGEEEEVAGVPGTGLGLPIAKNFVELMGGTISLQSEPGKGSEFTVRLPLALNRNAGGDDAEKTQQADRDAAEDLETVLSGKRILIVEDNEMNMEIATELLKIAGAVSDAAYSGTEAIEKLTQSPEHTYDLILMDVRMPDMDGYETTRRIRAMNREDAKTVPIIALTANAFEEDVDNARNAGMNAHIAKPLDMAQLSKTLTEVLKKR